MPSQRKKRLEGRETRKVSKPPEGNYGTPDFGDLMIGVSKALAEFASRLDFKELRKPALDMAKICFLDWLGSALAGSREEPAKILLDVVREIGGNPEATVIAYGDRSSCMNAALMNAAMSHILELDDVHKASILHPAAPIMPAALAVAEKEDADGKSLITAIIAGYEVAIRVGEAVNPAHYRYWHPTGTCGAFGAATAAGRLFHLDAQEMIDALGSAGTQAAGLWQFLQDGAMSKHLHPAKAASNGVLSALLARRGFTAAKAILEGERGFCRATSERYDLRKIVKNLGKGFKITEVSIKPYACCRHIHPVIDAVKKIIEEVEIHPQDVRKIKVKTYLEALQIAGNAAPKTPYEAKFSIPYCASVAIIRRQVGLEEFSQGMLEDPAVTDLMKKIEVQVDPKLSEQHPEKWPAEVSIETVDGKTHSFVIQYPLGDPENPIGDKELHDKFRTLASTVLSSQKIDSIMKLVENLEAASSVRSLSSLLY